MKLNKIIRLEKQFADWICNIYFNAARFQWDQSFLLECIKKEIWENEEYKKLPRYSHSFLDGVKWKCQRDHDKLVEFSYEIDGKRLSIRSDEYRKISPNIVSEKWSHTGAFIYKESPNKIWFQSPKQE